MVGRNSKTRSSSDGTPEKGAWDWVVVTRKGRQRRGCSSAAKQALHVPPDHVGMASAACEMPSSRAALEACITAAQAPVSHRDAGITSYSALASDEHRIACQQREHGCVRLRDGVDVFPAGCSQGATLTQATSHAWRPTPASHMGRGQPRDPTVEEEVQRLRRTVVDMQQKVAQSQFYR